MRALAPVFCLVTLTVGCDRPADWLDVERVEPGGSPSAPPIALNQALTVYFSDAIDPLSVTSESFRVADESGRTVDGFLEVGTRSVRFRPRTPLTTSLDDGSFRPGISYRLEVAGMPASFALRSRSGKLLRRGVACRFTTASTPEQLGMPSLFLPAGIGDEEFQVDPQSGGSLRVAADDRRLTIRLNMPPLPSSSRPEAFRLWRIVTGASAPEQVAIDEVSVRCPDESRPGGSMVAAVTLRIARSVPLEAGDLLYLEFAKGEEGGLVDFRGRALSLSAALPVKVDAGVRVRARDVDPATLVFEPDPDAGLSFEVVHGRIQPRARREAGTGRSGRLVVPAGSRLQLSSPDLLDDPSRSTSPGGDVSADFTSIEVEQGGELVLSVGKTPLLIRVTRDLVVRGRVTLEHSAREVPWRAGRSPGVEELARASGVCLVIGGDLLVDTSGEIRTTTETGSPVTLIVGGTPTLEGRMPPGVTLALPAQVRIQGVLEAPIVLPSELTPGTPPGAALRAAAATQWMPLPVDHGAAVDVELEDLRGDLRVYLEVAPPDVARPDRPRADVEHILAPMRLPLRQPLSVPAGAYFRLRFEAELDAAELPSLGGFSILTP